MYHLIFLTGYAISYTIILPYTILYTGFGVSGVPLTIIILWPGLYLIMYVIRKIKVGKHYSERNKNPSRYIPEIAKPKAPITETRKPIAAELPIA